MLDREPIVLQFCKDVAFSVSLRDAYLPQFIAGIDHQHPEHERAAQGDGRDGWQLRRAQWAFNSWPEKSPWYLTHNPLKQNRLSDSYLASLANNTAS